MFVLCFSNGTFGCKKQIHWLKYKRKQTEQKWGYFTELKGRKHIWTGKGIRTGSRKTFRRRQFISWCTTHLASASLCTVHPSPPTPLHKAAFSLPNFRRASSPSTQLRLKNLSPAAQPRTGNSCPQAWGPHPPLLYWGQKTNSNATNMSTSRGASKQGDAPKGVYHLHSTCSAKVEQEKTSQQMQRELHCCSSVVTEWTGINDPQHRGWWPICLTPGKLRGEQVCLPFPQFLGKRCVTLNQCWISTALLHSWTKRKGLRQKKQGLSKTWRSTAREGHRPRKVDRSRAWQDHCSLGPGPSTLTSIREAAGTPSSPEPRNSH